MPSLSSRLRKSGVAVVIKFRIVELVGVIHLKPVVLTFCVALARDLGERRKGFQLVTGPSLVFAVVPGRVAPTWGTGVEHQLENIDTKSDRERGWKTLWRSSSQECGTCIEPD